MRNRGTVTDAVEAGKKEHIHLLLPRVLAQQVRNMAVEGRRPLVTQIEMLLEEALEARTRLVAA